MSYLLKLRVSIFGFSLILFASNVFGANVTTIYFIPFEIETYVPITRATITSQAWEKWTISSKPKTSILSALLKNGDEAEFDENRVRSSIHSGNQTFFVDANGVVSSKGKLGIKINKTKYVRFRNLLQVNQREILKNKHIDTVLPVKL